MVTPIVTPTKITRPLPPPGTVQRSRLYALMEESHQSVIWLIAPPGAGKTTLISSYVEQSGLPTLWYQLDQGDVDPATFFHYLGLAAPRTSPALPHLTPEYLPSLSLFTRRYFEELYSRLEVPSLLVFDNYQDVGPEAALHTIMHTALAVLPPGIRVFVLSRSEPPPALVRLRATQTLLLLDGDTIRLTAEECQAIAQSHNPGLSDVMLGRLYEQTQGWAAGLILALEGGLGNSNPPLDAPQAVFDFFAEEIFKGMDDEAQQILLHCAFLPWVSVGQAGEITGMPGAGRLLADLNTRGYFTLKHAKYGYQFHPLFRAFLISRAELSYSAATLAELRRRAAGLLEADGEIAEAVELLFAAMDWEALGGAVKSHAPAMLQQGRAQTVERWLRMLPAGFLAEQPWCQYWLGMCRLAVAPVESRPHFETAFALFEAQDDLAGSLLTWAAIVDTFVYDWGDFAPLDRWIAVMDTLLSQQRPMLSPEIEARLACGMFAALMWRQPQRPDLPQWAERVMRIVLTSDAVPLKMALGSNVVLYCLWMGNFSKAAVIIDALRPYSHARDNDALTQMHWWVMLAMYSWYVADHAGCLAAISEGEQLANSSGVHLLDQYLLAQGIYSGLSQGDPGTAAKLLEKMWVVGSPRLMDKSLYHYQAASVHWHRGDLALARQHGQISIELALATGAPLPVALTCVELAFTLFEQGEHEAALLELKRGAEAGRGMKHIEFMNGLYAAHFALQSGERASALTTLRTAFSLGAREGYVNTPRWNAAVLAPLCALALEHDIEVEYVRGLIRRRALAAPLEDTQVEAWPWRVRIHTLGEFSVQLNDQPLDLARRDRRRPAELLKVIVALGGRRVTVADLTNALWPDAEGDAAYQAMHTNLHRLRKLLGKDLLRSEAGCISLDERYVWVDVWVLNGLSTRMASVFTRTNAKTPPDIEAIKSDASLLMSRYRGAFLAEASEALWAFPERNRMRERLIRLAEHLGNALESHGQWSQAVTLYEWAVEQLGPDVESLFMGVMRAHHHLGQPAEVARAYQRCRATLASLLQAPPSAALEALHLSLMSNGQS